MPDTLKPYVQNPPSNSDEVQALLRRMTEEVEMELDRTEQKDLRRLYPPYRIHGILFPDRVLADATGYSRSVVNRFRNGETKPAGPFMIALYLLHSAVMEDPKAAANRLREYISERKAEADE